MPDDDWMLSSSTVEFRQAERDHANGHGGPPIERGVRIPPECRCLTYGRGLSLTRVSSPTCPVHGKPTDG